MRMYAYVYAYAYAYAYVYAYVYEYTYDKKNIYLTMKANIMGRLFQVTEPKL